MRFVVTITEVDEEGEVVRYQQTVDWLDMHAVINAVNSTPRQRAQRSDAGKPRSRADFSKEALERDYARDSAKPKQKDEEIV